jgi:hypothetical protein
MNDSKDSAPKKPLLVSLGLWGIKTRQMALAFMWLCIAIAAVSAILKFWFGLFLLIAAWWYWYALRWVDKHGGWK